MVSDSLRDLMTENPAHCTPEDGIVAAAKAMLQADCGALPVVDTRRGRRVVGILTDRDIVCRTVAAGIDPREATVEQAMSTDVHTLTPDAGLDDCVRLMTDYRIRRIPIVDEQHRLVGMVAQADLARRSAADPAVEEDLADVLEHVSKPG